MNGLGTVLLLSVLIFGSIIVFAKLYSDKLISEGKIIRRDGKFFEAEYKFTLSNAPYKVVEKELKNTDLSHIKITESYYENGGRLEILLKAAGGWNVVINLIEENNGKYTYKLSFPVYTTRNGMALDVVKMNMLLTSVEKMFLHIDPETVVESELQDYKYKKGA